MKRRGFFACVLAAILGRKLVPEAANRGFAVIPSAPFTTKATGNISREDGLAAQHVSHYDAQRGVMVHRMDVLIGYGNFNPRMSARIAA